MNRSRLAMLSVVLLQVTAALLAVGCSREAANATQGAPPARSIESPPPKVSPEVSRLLATLEQLRRTGRAREGLELAQRYRQQHPDTPRLHYAIGVLHGYLENHDAAMQAFALELAADPGHFESRHGMAAALTRLGRLDESLPFLHECLSMRPDEVEVRFQLGRNLSGLGRLDEARAPIEVSVAALDSADAWAELGLLERRSERWQQAREAFATALRREPEHLAALLNLGQILQRLGDTNTAGMLLEHHRRRAKLADQLDQAERSSRLAGASATNFVRLAELQMAYGQAKAAQTSYRQALQRDPRNVPAALGLAINLLESGAADEAMPLAAGALLRAPQSAKSHYVLGRVRLARGQLEAAEAAFAASRQSGVWSQDTVTQTVRILREAGHPDAAARTLTLAEEEFDAFDADLLRERGLLQLAQARPQAAQANLRAATAAAPDDMESWLGMALALETMGDTGAADLALAQAVALARVRTVFGHAPESLARTLRQLPDAEAVLDGFERRLRESAAPD